MSHNFIHFSILVYPKNLMVCKFIFMVTLAFRDIIRLLCGLMQQIYSLLTVGITSKVARRINERWLFMRF